MTKRADIAPVTIRRAPCGCYAIILTATINGELHSENYAHCENFSDVLMTINTNFFFQFITYLTSDYHE
jgi:hypothetical protein